jgi:hypothetical protein
VFENKMLMKIPESMTDEASGQFMILHNVKFMIYTGNLVAFRKINPGG